MRLKWTKAANDGLETVCSFGRFAIYFNSKKSRCLGRGWVVHYWTPSKASTMLINADNQAEAKAYVMGMLNLLKQAQPARSTCPYSKLKHTFIVLTPNTFKWCKRCGSVRTNNIMLVPANES